MKSLFLILAVVLLLFLAIQLITAFYPWVLALIFVVETARRFSP